MNYVNPVDLLGASRFDLFARTNFVRSELQGFGESWGRSVYRDFIVSTSRDRRGKESWGEDNKKYSFKDYEKSFKNLINSISSEGYLESFGAIPLSGETITNGAHRLAICLLLDKKIPVENHPSLPVPNYDYKWLISKGMRGQNLDQMALDFVRMSKRCRALVFFGQNESTMNKILKFQDLKKDQEIVYTKKINLTEIGMRRIVQACYQMNDWWEENLLEKMCLERFENREKSIYVSVVKSISQEDFIQYKTFLREEFCSAEFERTIHGTDNHNDTFEVLSTLLNHNGIYFLNNSPIGSESRIMDLLKNEAQAIKSEDWAIDGSASKEMLGKRRANDIDYICLDILKDKTMNNKIFDRHEKFYDNLPIDYRELIFDPRLHFSWNGYKFATENVADFLRNEYKLDVNFSLPPLYIDSSGFAKARMNRLDYKINKIRIAISPLVPNLVKVYVKKAINRANNS